MVYGNHECFSFIFDKAAWYVVLVYWAAIEPFITACFSCAGLRAGTDYTFAYYGFHGKSIISCAQYICILRISWIKYIETSVVFGGRRRAFISLSNLCPGFSHICGCAKWKYLVWTSWIDGNYLTDWGRRSILEDCHGNKHNPFKWSI